MNNIQCSPKPTGIKLKAGVRFKPHPAGSHYISQMQRQVNQLWMKGTLICKSSPESKQIKPMFLDELQTICSVSFSSGLPPPVEHLMQAPELNAGPTVGKPWHFSGNTDIFGAPIPSGPSALVTVNLFPLSCVTEPEYVRYLGYPQKHSYRLGEGL